MIESPIQRVKSVINKNQIQVFAMLSIPINIFQVAEEAMEVINEQPSETSQEQHITVDLVESTQQGKAHMQVQPVDEQITEEDTQQIEAQVMDIAIIHFCCTCILLGI